MVVLVCGDRNWDDYDTIRKELKKLPKGSVIVHGDCRGADKIAGEVAMELGLKVIAFPAEWGKYGKSAGPIRNAKVLEETRPDLVLAFHDDLENSKGTKDMVYRAAKENIMVKIISRRKLV
jgi:hypothetical protein